MATNSNPSSIAWRTVAIEPTPPSRMSGRSQRSAELASVGEEVALFERIAVEEVATDELERASDGPGHDLRHLRHRGLSAEVVHGVLQ